MNYYVLHVLAAKTDRLLRIFNANPYLDAFMPMYEYYRRDEHGYALKHLFPNYIFIKTDYTQSEFDDSLITMKEDKDGLIRQLRYKEEGLTCLRDNEVDLLSKLLDRNHILRMSRAIIINKRAAVFEGPLVHFEKDIVKVDKHNRLAWLDVTFLNRNILAGLEVVNPRDKKIPSA